MGGFYKCVLMGYFDGTYLVWENWCGLSRQIYFPWGGLNATPLGDLEDFFLGNQMMRRSNNTTVFWSGSQKKYVAR